MEIKSGLEFEKFKLLDMSSRMERASSEEGCEDPFVMSLDAIVGDDRSALAAAGDAYERT